MFAVERGHDAVVDLLLSYGAQAEFRNKVSASSVIDSSLIIVNR